MGPPTCSIGEALIEASDSMVRMVIMLVIYFIIIYIIKLEINHLITTYSLLPCPRHNTTITAEGVRKLCALIQHKVLSIDKLDISNNDFERKLRLIGIVINSNININNN
jgi:hypothetical protein